MRDKILKSYIAKIKKSFVYLVYVSKWDCYEVSTLTVIFDSNCH